MGINFLSILDKLIISIITIILVPPLFNYQHAKELLPSPTSWKHE
jgi:hypothetical protein